MFALTGQTSVRIQSNPGNEAAEHFNLEKPGIVTREDSDRILDQ